MGATNQKIVNFQAAGENCLDCRLKPLCLARDLNCEEAARLDKIVRRQRSLKRGQHLFRQGVEFNAVYTIRSGSLKTYTTTEDGHEQVTGFYFPGMLVGLDAISSGEHPTSCAALETVSVCEIPFSSLSAVSATIPALQQQLIRIMSQQIIYDENHAVVLGKKSAEARLATLLLSLAKQFRQRGYSANEFNLHMSRRDIANYLGLALETVSRSFSRLQQRGLITVDRHYIKVHDLDLLAEHGLEPEEAVQVPAAARRHAALHTLQSVVAC